MSTFISLVRDLERAYEDFKKASANKLPSLGVPERTAQGVLSYLGRYYFSERQWALSAFTDGQPYFHTFLLARKPELVKKIDRYIARDALTADENGGAIDIGHIAAAGYIYAFNAGLAKRHWTNWGGDLATGIRLIEEVMNKNPRANRQRITNEVIGAHALHGSYTHSIKNDVIASPCSYTDFTSDADAINIALMLKSKQDLQLSSALKDYYHKLTANKRYRGFHADLPLRIERTALAEKIYELVATGANIVLWGAKAGVRTSEESGRAGAMAFANYLQTILGGDK